jgi:hypothetical protein
MGEPLGKKEISEMRNENEGTQRNHRRKRETQCPNAINSHHLGDDSFPPTSRKKNDAASHHCWFFISVPHIGGSP